jgi:hypothetical protein
VRQYTCTPTEHDDTQSNNCIPAWTEVDGGVVAAATGLERLQHLQQNLRTVSSLAAVVTMAQITQVLRPAIIKKQTNIGVLDAVSNCQRSRGSREFVLHIDFPARQLFYSTLLLKRNTVLSKVAMSLSRDLVM